MTDEERAKWLEDRRTGIGGSDAAAVLGLSRWSSPYDVYASKLGLAPPVEETWPMKWGTWMEPHLRQAYSNLTGREVLAHTGVLRHPKYPWMLATLDGMTDDNRLVEIKTSRSSDGWGEPGSSDIPEAYMIQVQHYLTVTAVPVADVILGLFGQEPRIYEVPADPELQEMILEAEQLFWARVMRAEPPEPVTLADAQARYGKRSTARSVVADGSLVNIATRLARARAELAKLQASEEELKAEIMIAMGEADTLVDSAGRVLATWKLPKAGARLSLAEFMAAHPDLYKQFCKPSDASRRFLLK